MRNRLELHEKLCNILGSSNVYFQPPESMKLNYPCIIYERNGADMSYANDNPYGYVPGYDVTLIYKDPDNDLVKELAMAFPMMRHNRHFTSDNLNHDVYTLYY